jgi:hypothetical protein
MTNLLLIAISERLILSWDPSLLIPTREYELGFHDAFASGGTWLRLDLNGGGRILIEIG